MAKPLLILILSISLVSIPSSYATFLDPFISACLGPHKSTKIQVFFRATYSGPNQSVFEVARSSITATSPSQFGLVTVSDVKLTTGPDDNSQEVGRAQGVSASADLRVPAIAELGSNVYFTAGKFNGSTLTVLGRNPFQPISRELSVVGGTGMFRCARGYVNSTRYYADNTTSVFQASIYTTYVDI